MSQAPSPQVGFNTNVRHKNRVFHLQTEDSGLARPHVITHLFMDGGRILKSEKRSYAEHVGREGCAATVRQLMKEQHRALFIALREGQFDGLIEGSTEALPEATPSTKTTGDLARAAVERSSHAVTSASGGPPALESASPRDRAAGSYSHVVGRSSPPQASSAPRDHALQPAASPDARYARARPAAIFEARTEGRGASLLTPEAETSRALDEAILAFIAGE